MARVFVRKCRDGGGVRFAGLEQVRPEEREALNVITSRFWERRPDDLAGQLADLRALGAAGHERVRLVPPGQYRRARRRLIRRKLESRGW